MRGLRQTGSVWCRLFWLHKAWELVWLTDLRFLGFAIIRLYWLHLEFSGVAVMHFSNFFDCIRDLVDLRSCIFCVFIDCIWLFWAVRSNIFQIIMTAYKLLKQCSQKSFKFSLPCIFFQYRATSAISIHALLVWRKPHIFWAGPEGGVYEGDGGLADSKLAPS